MASPIQVGMSPGHATFYFCAIAAALYLAYRWALPRPIPGIPYDEKAKNSLLGNLPEVLAMLRTSGRTRPFFIQHPQRHQSAITQLWMGPLQKPVVVLSDFRESQDILLRRTREFDRGPLSTQMFTGVVPEHHIAMTTNDPRFKSNRELVRDLMTPNFLHEVSAPQIYAKTLALVELWGLKAQLGEGRPFNARRDIFDAAMDIINAVTFGLDEDQSTLKNQVDFLQDQTHKTFRPRLHDENGSVEFPELATLPDVEAVEAIAAHLGEQFKAPFPRLAHRFAMLTSPTLSGHFARKDVFLRREIDKAVLRLRGSENGDGATRSAMDHVLRREMNAAAKAGRQPVFHSPQIYDELFGYLIAGHDTSSTSLAWMVKNLSDYPEVQTKLRSALREAYASAHASGHQPSVTELWKTPVPYLDAVIEETLRIDGPIPLVFREAVVDTEVLGHRVPRGTAVFLMSDGPDYTRSSIPVAEEKRSVSSKTSLPTNDGRRLFGAWDQEDIHLFRPERWLRQAADTEGGGVTYEPRSGPMLAFGLGPRGCFGRRLAYLEIRIVLALLVWNFEFRTVEGPLGSRDSFDTMTKNPVRCYLALNKITA